MDVAAIKAVAVHFNGCLPSYVVLAGTAIVQQHQFYVTEKQILLYFHKSLNISVTCLSGLLTQLLKEKPWQIYLYRTLHT